LFVKWIHLVIIYLKDEGQSLFFQPHFSHFVAIS